MFRFFILFLICFVSTTVSACRTTIVVKNQTEFDGLQEKLTNTIKAGKKNICVNLMPGNYIAKDNHILLKDIKAPDTKIHIQGKDAVLIPEGIEYHDGDAYQGAFSTDNSWMTGTEDVEIWSYVQYADGLVDVLDTIEKRCRIKCKNTFSKETDISNAYILITHWFHSSIYKIDKIDGKYIYFTADDLKTSSYGGYNMNDDYNYGKKDIRYKLCNVVTSDDCISVVDGKVHLPDGVTSVREGKTHNFMTLKNCRFSSVEIMGIEFRGGAFLQSDPAVIIKKTECESIRIHKCSFYGMRGNVISITASPNVKVDNCRFEDCYQYAVMANNESANTVVEKNRFTSMGKRMDNTYCVRCQGTNHRVSDNVFIDFGYGGIFTGVSYRSTMKQPSVGVIENNDLSFTKDYLDHIDNYGIMDGGAIVIAGQNAGTIVRYNYIHGFSGMKSNRGIFCDNGASNFELYGNVITGIANSWCIDSRRVKKAERANNPDSKMERANVNISIHDNIVDGGIRFEANEDLDNGCVKGGDYILCASNDELPKMKVNHVTDAEEDIVLEYTGMKDGIISLSSQSYSQLKRNKNCRSVSSYFIN
jgi:hypothetical protein